MGAWGPGPFENDDAQDFLAQAQASPARAVGRALRNFETAKAQTYVEVEDGGAAWAAAELVALAFGRGDPAAVGDHVLDVARRLRPTEALRRQALGVLPQLADPDKSEVAGLWHEGGDGVRFDAAIADLGARLEAGAAGPVALPAAKVGDVVALQATSDSAVLVVFQVVASGEVAVFDGTFADEDAALSGVRDRRGQRVPARVNALARAGRLLGNEPVRKDLKGKTLYASESGAIDEYCLMTAAAGGYRQVSYEEARTFGSHYPHDADAIRTVASGRAAFPSVRSPAEREAELLERHGADWSARRARSTPGPFGDIEHLAGLLEWIEMTGVANVVHQCHELALGNQGYGRPNEHSERQSYAFAGLVALWLGTWPQEAWPAKLTSRLPPQPDDTLMALAVAAARALASRVITRDAELRLIWDNSPDNGAALRESVASLQAALAPS